MTRIGRRAKSREPKPVRRDDGHGNSVQNSVARPGTMPGRNGGRLRRGNPGNAGRPAYQLRAKCLASGLARVRILEAIADDKKATHRDRIQAIALLFRYGVSDDAQLRTSFVMAGLRGTILDIRDKLCDFLPEAEADRFIRSLERHWEE